MSNCQVAQWVYKNNSCIQESETLAPEWRFTAQCADVMQVFDSASAIKYNLCTPETRPIHVFIRWVEGGQELPWARRRINPNR